MKTRTLAIAVGSLVSICLVRPIALRSRVDPGWPPNGVTQDSPAYAGQTVTFTISFEGSNSTDEDLYLSASPNVFDNLPSHVSVLAGHTSVDVTAMIDPNSTGGFSLTARNSLGSAISPTAYIVARSAKVRK